MVFDVKSYYLQSLIILLLLGCQRYYIKEFVPDTPLTERIDGWGMDVSLRVIDENKPAPEDTSYQTFVTISRPVEDFQDKGLKSELDIRKRFRLEIQSISIRLGESDEEKKLTLRSRSEGYPYSGRVGWDFSYDLVSIPRDVERIQLHLIVLYTRLNEDLGTVKREFRIEMVRHEDAKRRVWLPMY